MPVRWESHLTGIINATTVVTGATLAVALVALLNDRRVLVHRGVVRRGRVAGLAPVAPASTDAPLRPVDLRGTRSHVARHARPCGAGAPHGRERTPDEQPQQQA